MVEGKVPDVSSPSQYSEQAFLVKSIKRPVTVIGGVSASCVRYTTGPMSVPLVSNSLTSGRLLTLLIFVMNVLCAIPEAAS